MHDLFQKSFETCQISTIPFLVQYFNQTLTRPDCDKSPQTYIVFHLLSFVLIYFKIFFKA